jgi:hypothetical protein
MAMPQTDQDLPSSDILASLPTELQQAILVNIRRQGGIQALFPPRSVSSEWCRLIDDHLYLYFVSGPEVLYCYVNLWNRFRQKLIQQRVVLRLRFRTVQFTPKSQDPTPPDQGPEPQTGRRHAYPLRSPPHSDEAAAISWQPSSQSSGNPSLSPRDYTAYIYDACFDHKFDTERDQIHPVDIHPRTPSPISLGSGLTALLERANQPPRSGTIFPLFHVIQEAWDFILGEDAALMPIYPPIASEAWLQIRLATGLVAARYREPPAIYVEPSRDPHWPFRFDEYSRFPTERNVATGQHQYAVTSRLARPNLVQDEGILLVTVRHTQVSEWIQDARYREIMQSMINVADVGGPQEFILGGAVVQLDDFERFIPRGMGEWFRRRILLKRTRTATPESVRERSEWTDEEEAHPDDPEDGSVNDGMQGNVMRRLQHAMEILRDDGRRADDPPMMLPGLP